MINAERKLWRDQRRFLHEKLRGFGITNVNSKNTKLHDLINVSKTKIIKMNNSIQLTIIYLLSTNPERD